MKHFCLTLLALTTLSSAPALAQVIGERLRERLAPSPSETLSSASVILGELSNIPAKGIPPTIMAEAHGIAVIPRVVKAGFVVAGSGGHGLVIARDKTGQWGPPVFLNFGGASLGFQAGVESTDVVLVFRNRKSLDRLLEGKGKVTLGVDAGVAAGPVGRQAMASTDTKLEAEIVSYSRSRGLFAGVAFNGAVLNPDDHSNALFRADVRPEVAQQVAGLKVILNAMSSLPPPPPGGPVMIVPIPVVPAPVPVPPPASPMPPLAPPPPPRP